MPKFLRSVGDNDDLRILLGSLVHDANFACNFWSFELSNQMLKQMVHYNFIIKNLIYLSVSSSIARKSYDKTDEEIELEKQFVSLETCK